MDRVSRIAVVASLLALTASAAAQMRNPPPASIYSVGGSTLGGPPASINSLPAQSLNSHGFFFGGKVGFGHNIGGKVGFGHNPRFTLSNKPLFGRRSHRPVLVVPAYLPYPVYPYYGVVYEPPSPSLEGAGTFDRPQAADTAREEPPAPTIFERRSRTERRPAATDDERYGEHYLDEREPRAAPKPEPAAPAVEQPASELPETVLIFRDGKRTEVRNYAIMGPVLFVLSGQYRKIPLAELDLEATARENDDRGITFRIPATSN